MSREHVVAGGVSSQCGEGRRFGSALNLNVHFPLFVEDDPAVRAVTVRSLRAGGYRVLVVAAAQDALDIAKRERGRLRLLVTDVVMPGLDGRALANELVRRDPDLRVLYVSGHAEDVIVTRGVVEPGLAFLPKPFTASSLLARVCSVLDT